VKIVGLEKLGCWGTNASGYDP